MANQVDNFWEQEEANFWQQEESKYQGGKGEKVRAKVKALPPNEDQKKAMNEGNTSLETKLNSGFEGVKEGVSKLAGFSGSGEVAGLAAAAGSVPQERSFLDTLKGNAVGFGRAVKDAALSPSSTEGLVRGGAKAAGYDLPEMPAIARVLSNIASTDFLPKVGSRVLPNVMDELNPNFGEAAQEQNNRRDSAGEADPLAFTVGDVAGQSLPFAKGLGGPTVGGLAKAPLNYAKGAFPRQAKGVRDAWKGMFPDKPTELPPMPSERPNYGRNPPPRTDVNDILSDAQPDNVFASTPEVTRNIRLPQQVAKEAPSFNMEELDLPPSMLQSRGTRQLGGSMPEGPFPSTDTGRIRQVESSAEQMYPRSTPTPVSPTAPTQVKKGMTPVELMNMPTGVRKPMIDQLDQQARSRKPMKGNENNTDLFGSNVSPIPEMPERGTLPAVPSKVGPSQSITEPTMAANYPRDISMAEKFEADPFESWQKQRSDMFNASPMNEIPEGPAYRIGADSDIPMPTEPVAKRNIEIQETVDWLDSEINANHDINPSLDYLRQMRDESFVSEVLQKIRELNE